MATRNDAKLRAPITDDVLAGIVQNEIMRGEGGDTDELQKMRVRALDLYFNRAGVYQAVPGRSQVQSSDIADMTNAVLAQLMPMVGNDCVAEFEPESDDDAQAAKLESAAVNRVVLERNGGLIELQKCIKDAALMRNTVAKVWFEDRDDTVTQEFEAITDLQLAEMVRDVRPDVTVEILEREETSDADTGAYAKLRVTRTDRQFMFSAVPPENFVYAQGQLHMDLQRIRFQAERRRDLTRSDLVEMGFDRDQVYSLPEYNTDTKTDALARERYRSHKLSGQTADQDKLEVYEVYLRIDTDGDGISELWQMFYCNMQLLEHEDWGVKKEAPFSPYVAGTLIPHPHRFQGESLVDRLEQLQAAKTATLRQYIDNLAVNNNQRAVVVESLVDFETAEDSRPGGLIVVKDQDAYREISVNDVGSGAIQFLEYMDKVRMERGGAALDMQGPQEQLAGETWRGIERQYGAKELVTAMYARSFAETLVRGVYLLMHKTLRTYARSPVRVKQSGQYRDTLPTQWPPRDQINVRIGLSAGARAQQSAALSQTLQLQTLAMQNGLNGIAVTWEHMYRAACDWLASAEIDNPEMYFVDPNSPQSQQAQQQAAQQAQQQQSTIDRLAMVQAQVEQMKVRQDQMQADQEIQLKYTELAAKLEIEEAKLVGSATKEMEIESIRQRGAAAQAAATGGSNGSGGGNS